MKKKMKYKREHFDTDEDFKRFCKGNSERILRWLKKTEEKNPEKRERRLLRQRLYSRYYCRMDYRHTFSDWMKEKYGVADIKTLSVEELRGLCEQKLNL